jgi:hypothetical protein
MLEAYEQVPLYSPVKRRAQWWTLNV